MSSIESESLEGPRAGLPPLTARRPRHETGARALDSSVRDRALAALGIAVLLAAALIGVVVAADGSVGLVPSGREDFAGWLAGPLAPLGDLVPPMSDLGLIVLFGIMGAAYLVVLAFGGAVPLRLAIGAVAAAHLIFLLAPPILSTDVFGYLAFARLGVEHGLDPYANAVDAIPRDPINTYLSPVWPIHLSTPYGPPFVSFTYLLVPLGIPAGLWALKAATAIAAFAAVALVAACARRLGRPAAPAALFVGLNPLWLAWTVGGAHNDLLMVGPLALGVYLLAGARRAGLAGAALAGAVAVKATAGLVLVFALVGGREGLRTFAGAAAGGLALTAATFAVFGTDLLRYPSNLAEQGNHLSRHNVPENVANLFGVALTPQLQTVVAAVFALAVVALLVRVGRGADWITGAGWGMVAFLLTTTSLHTWYVAGLLPLAALSTSRALRVSTLAVSLLLIVVQLMPALSTG